MHRRRRPRRRLQAPLSLCLAPSSASPAGTPPKLLSVAAATAQVKHSEARSALLSEAKSTADVGLYY